MEDPEDSLQLKILLKEKCVELDHVSKEFREFQNMSKLLEAELESELESAMVAKIEAERETSGLKDKNIKLSLELCHKIKELSTKTKELEALKLSSKPKPEMSEEKKAPKAEDDIKSALKELEMLRGQKSEWEREKKSFKDKIDKLENECADKTKYLESLSEAKKELEKNKRLLKKKAERAESDLIVKSRDQDENAKKSKEKNQEAIEKLEQNVKILENDNEKMKVRIQNMQKDSKEALAQYQNALRKIEVLEEEMEEMKGKLRGEGKNKKILQEMQNKRRAKTPERELPDNDFRVLIDRIDEKDAIFMIDNLLESITNNAGKFKQQ